MNLIEKFIKFFIKRGFKTGQIRHNYINISYNKEIKSSLIVLY